ncbi:uncharacterized protein LOC143450534 [Clavelina lepadiformis]|uniref:uncharacterized protein LOC143450534 n=1 Tax=Clavelina lepadiformis TaxID=159417 RepID=UPI0040427BD9
MKSYILFKILLFLASVRWTAGFLKAPSSVQVEDQTYFGFTLTFDRIRDVAHYEVSYKAQHDRESYGSLFTATNVCRITGLKSNTNYHVKVRGVRDVERGNYSNVVVARTAPRGTTIVQVITAPTFVTIFLEETPGAVKWEVEYIDTVTGVKATKTVPDDVPSQTYYVAIIAPLSPNTVYELRVRVVKLSGFRDYNKAQSPYGETTISKTDKVSAFGRVQLITRSYTSTDNTNTALKIEIATELLNAYQSVASNTVDVSVVELENDGSGSILCHHEIVLNDRHWPPDISDFVLNNAELYLHAMVHFDAIGGLGYYYGYLSHINTHILGYGGGLLCDDISTDKRFWTLYDRNEKVQAVLPTVDDESPKHVAKVNISEREVVIDERTVFNFSQNTLYAIKQEYLIKTCPERERHTTYYNRLYGAKHIMAPVESDQYTIFNTSGLWSLPRNSLTFERTTSVTSVLVKIPSVWIKRAVGFTLSVNSVLATLQESDLDSSSLYLVHLFDLPKHQSNIVTVEATSRKHDGSLSKAKTSLLVTTDFNECTEENPCHINARCLNNVESPTCFCNAGYTGDGFTCSDINECNLYGNRCSNSASCTNLDGGFSCTCNNGYGGNGISCVDIDECVTNTHNCHTNANCANANGGFTCSCREGYSGNGISCVDIDECVTNTHNCHTNANCINTEGSFTCNCNAGYTGNGKICIDIDECTLGIEKCHPRANCTNAAGSFACYCNNGYSGNGSFCSSLLCSEKNCFSERADIGGRSLVWLIGPVLGGLLLFLLAVVVLTKKLKNKQKGLYDLPEARSSLNATQSSASVRFQRQRNEDGGFVGSVL